jgi:metal-responsive CopG/Arc/MetJ family transcriptional regulator
MLAFVPLKAGRGRFIRLNITLEENILAELDRAAKMRGMSRSGFIAEAVRRLLEATQVPAPSPRARAAALKMARDRAGRSRF